MSLPRFRFAIVPVMASVAIALAACSSGGGAAEKPAAPATSGGGAAATVKATMKEFTITLAPTAAKAGDVKFDGQNTGTITHELVVLKTDLAQDKLPVKDGNVDESAVSAAGKIADIETGKTKSATLKLEPGKYVIFCNVAGHYAAGMHTTFTVN